IRSEGHGRSTTRSVGRKRTRRYGRAATISWRLRGRTLGGHRRHLRRCRWRRHRCALGRAEDVVSEVDSVVRWDPLSDQRRVNRVRTEHVLAHRQWLKRLLTLTDFDRRRALAGLTHAGVVARTTHPDR